MIRRMETPDVPAAMRLKQAAGWNQTEQDWINVLALEPEGCWVWEQDGQVVGTTTAVCYGQELAWIGMVLVLPEFRGQGIARRLMEHSLEWLEARGVRQVKLDATDMGRQLYAKLGFRDERIIERWAGGRGLKFPRGLKPAPPSPAPPWLRHYDQETFGADRSRLLARLVETWPEQGVWREPEGFLLGRPGSNYYFLGPGAASSVASAEVLARELLARAPAENFFWDLFPDQPAMVELARRLGFERRRGLVRMALRPEMGAGRPERVFAAAGFEYG